MLPYVLGYNIGDDVTQVKVESEPSGFWEYGGCCLGNRCSGPAYVMSQVSEVLMPTYLPSCYYKEKEKIGSRKPKVKRE